MNNQLAIYDILFESETEEAVEDPHNRSGFFHKDSTQFIFDILGLIPGFGVPFNIVNTITYAQEGQWLNATLSFIGSIPAIGEAIRDGGWLATKLLRLFNEGSKTAEAVKAILKHSQTAIKMIKKGLEFYYGNKWKIKAAIKLLKNSQDENIKKYISPYIHKMEESLGVLEHNFQGMEDFINSSSVNESALSLEESIEYIKQAQRKILAEEKLKTIIHREIKYAIHSHR